LASARILSAVVWFRDEESWRQDLGFDVFCRWFDFQHHSMLVDLSDEPLIDELD